MAWLGARPWDENTRFSAEAAGKYRTIDDGRYAQSTHTVHSLVREGCIASVSRRVLCNETYAARAARMRRGSEDHHLPLLNTSTYFTTFGSFLERMETPGVRDVPRDLAGSARRPA